ncbi:Glycosyl transferase, family 2 domain protein [Candidatus Magnetobacterium bavaricum]|uniref:Glycosyl transferase, family 2 domain protein n=1 Tax=Candidatus Magnetobacterium bavaricum TaxID=29290 RepID=A0A0F3GHV5_9BACT|nr:Glycosyl transferase, family 2 domain protein [Candidatus Magnetobacterium bavaricum]
MNTVTQGANSLPRISVITPTLNQGRYIEHTIQSVIAQDYPNFEHIVIDGGSTDGTLDVLRRYPHLKWISEKDNGQADALNKGIARASGDIIAWINSDDYYCHNAFHTIAKTFEMNPLTNIVLGQTLYLFENTMSGYISRNRGLTFEEIIRYWDDFAIPSQPSVFFKAGILDETGLFDASLHYTMDFDMWLRMSLKHRFYFIPDVLVVYRFHDESKSGFANWSNFFPEYHATYMRHKNLSNILPDGPLVTLALPFIRKELEKSQWYLQKMKHTFYNLASQKVRDVEAIVITDTDEPERLLELTELPFPVRFIRVPTLDTDSFYRALTENARGFAIHCPSIEAAFDIDWFATALTYLLKNRDTDIHTTTPHHGAFSLSSGNNALTTMGIVTPDTHVMIRRDALKVPNPFEYPHYNTPLITFIVSAYGDVTQLLYLSLFSIYEHCVNHPYEVRILTEKGHSADYIRSICNATVFEAEGDDNRFRVLNDIANSATGKYLFFMSSTIVLTPSSVSEVLRTFAEHSHAGIVGTKTLSAAGVIDNAACVMLVGGLSLKYGQGKPRQDPDYKYLRDVDFFTLDFLAISRQVWSEVNGLDTLSCPVSLLDADLCFKVNRLGYGVLCQPEAEVFDYRPYESPQNEGILRKYDYRDFIRFKEKWRGQLKDSLFANSNNPWVLFLCHRLPLAQSSQLYTSHLPIQLFKKAGFNVAIHTEEVDVVQGHNWLNREGIKVFYNNVDFYEFTRDTALQFNVVWLEDRSIALYRSTIIRRLSGSLVLIYDATAMTSNEDKSGVFFRETNLSNLDKIQIARDRLIAKMVNIVYTCSNDYGCYMLSLNQQLRVRLTPAVDQGGECRDASPVIDIHDLLKVLSYRRTISEETAYGFAEILKLENAIKELASSGIKDIVDRCGQRPLYIWGAGIGGIQTRRILSSMGASTIAFLDKSPQKQLTTVDGLPVYDPVAVLKTPAHQQRPYVVIGSIYSSAISANLIELGYESEKDFAVNLLL